MPPHRWPNDGLWRRPTPDAAQALSVVSLTPKLLDELLDAPAAAPPPGQTVDFNTPDNLHAVAFATVVICLTFATLFLAMRMYTKAILLRALHWEDFCLFLSWLCWIPYCGLCIVVQPHAGIHIWNVKLRDVFFGVLYYADIIEIIYCPTITFVKLSILLQYRRIFLPDRRSTPFLWFGIWCLFWANIAFYSCTCLLKIFQCQPREAIWNKLIPATCLDVDSILISAAAFNLASDVVLFALPQYSIWRLQMDRRRKIGLSAVFGVGGLACVVTALRVQTSVELIYTADVTWYLAPAAMWSVAEVSLAIIACCLPAMPKFWQRVKEHWSLVTESERIQSQTSSERRREQPRANSRATILEKMIDDGGLKNTVETTVTSWPFPASLPREQHSALSDYWKTWYKDDSTEIEEVVPVEVAEEQQHEAPSFQPPRPPTPHPVAFHRTDPLPPLEGTNSGAEQALPAELPSPLPRPALVRHFSHPVPLRPATPPIETMPPAHQSPHDAPVLATEMWGHEFDPPRPRTCLAEDFSRWVDAFPLPSPPLPVAVCNMPSRPSPHNPWDRSPRHIAQCFRTNNIPR